MSELLILIEGDLAGQIRAEKSGRLSLSYESNWRATPRGYALSRQHAARRDHLSVAPLARLLIQHAHERLASIATVRAKRRPHGGSGRSS